MFDSIAKVIAFAALLGAPAVRVADRAASTTYQGAFPDGATYLIEVPASWNGTLVLYSHGYMPPGSPNKARDSSDAATGNYLLSRGYALGGSSYASTGWAVAQALPDQIAVLDTFATVVGSPTRTIAWGDSEGGLITAGLVQQYPTRFNGALPMCGVVGGAVGEWDLALDAAVVFNTLLAAGTVQIVNITGSPTANYNTAISVLDNAQKTAQGQARIALAAAVADTPGWFGSTNPAPAPTDYATQEANQYRWFKGSDFHFDFEYRAELESRAGGNPSFNTGVNYGTQLGNSIDRAEVEALYKKAGLNLNADLKTLQNTTRIAANAASLKYLSDNIIFDGVLTIPVLTIHTEGDGLVGNQNESAYATVVASAGNAALLRQRFIARAGHCAFTPAERLAALQALVDRLDTGSWNGLSPASLNSAAGLLGSQYNPVPPAYADYSPAPFLRPFSGTPP